MFARLHFQHEPDERPLQPGAEAGEDGETRPAEFRGALQVEDAQRRAEFVVRTRLEVERARFADAPDFAVRVLVRAHRDFRGRKVRQFEQPLVQLALRLLQPLLDLGHPVRRLRQLRPEALRRLALAGAVEGADFAVLRLEIRADRADFPLQRGPFLEAGENAGEVPVVAAVAQPTGGFVGVSADRGRVEHRC